jgi:hypothetical protein
MRRKCSICKSIAKFLTSDGKGFCGSPDCGLAHHARIKEAQIVARLKKRKEELKDTVSNWKRWVQDDAFNPYIRERDKDKPCISCGRYDHEIEEKLRGGKFECGHYLSVGSHPELRFDPLNAHKQCKSCNGGSGKYARKNHTVSQSYRINLIERIGIKNVEWLDGPHEPRRYRVDELKEMYDHFKSLTRKLRNEASKSDSFNKE